VKYACTPVFNHKVFVKLYFYLSNLDFFSNTILRVKVFVPNKKYPLYTSYIKLNTDLIKIIENLFLHFKAIKTKHISIFIMKAFVNSSI